MLGSCSPTDTGRSVRALSRLRLKRMASRSSRKTFLLTSQRGWESIHNCKFSKKRGFWSGKTFLKFRQAGGHGGVKAVLMRAVANGNRAAFLVGRGLMTKPLGSAVIRGLMPFKEYLWDLALLSVVTGSSGSCGDTELGALPVFGLMASCLGKSCLRPEELTGTHPLLSPGGQHVGVVSFFLLSCLPLPLPGYCHAAPKPDLSSLQHSRWATVGQEVEKGRRKCREVKLWFMPLWEALWVKFVSYSHPSLLPSFLRFFLLSLFKGGCTCGMWRFPG